MKYQLLILSLLLFSISFLRCADRDMLDDQLFMHTRNASLKGDRAFLRYALELDELSEIKDPDSFLETLTPEAIEDGACKVRKKILKEALSTIQKSYQANYEKSRVFKQSSI